MKGFASYGLYDLAVTAEPMEVNHDIQYIYYGILGLLCGVLGSLFIQILTKLIYLRTKIKAPFIRNRWKL